MKNLKNREGYKNRHTDELPKEACIIKIIHEDSFGEAIFLCEWKPFNEQEYTNKMLPDKGYLGTAEVISGTFKGIGFNAWQQNNSEFIYYAKN